MCVGTSELLEAQELALFEHSLGLENMKHYRYSVYNYRHFPNPVFNIFFHFWQCFFKS